MWFPIAAWLLLQSPHFELFTDAGEKAGREALQRLELIRDVFGRETPLPVRVVVFKSARDWRDFRPTPNTLGFYQSAPERDWIAMIAGEESYRAIFHEFVHLVLNHSSGPLPRWLEEGTAEFFSTLRMTAEDRVVLGGAIPPHVRLLLTAQWLDAGALSSAKPSHEQVATALFYAQSWALAHMLNMAPGYRTALPRFATLLDQSIPPPLAFEQAFGKPLAAALQDLRAYVKQGRFAVAEVLARNPNPEITVTPADSTAPTALIELLLQMGRAEQAEKRIAELPDTPENTIARGLLALSRKQNKEAMGLFRKAIDGGSTSAVPYFEYAELLRETGAPPAEVRRYLSEAAGRNPLLAEAQFLLGLSEQLQSNHRNAIGYFENAVKILPRQSYFWHALATSYKETGDTARARRAAFKAVDAAKTDHELEMAQAALRAIGQATPPAPPAPKKDVIVPDSWKAPKGEKRAEGVLEHVDCLGPNARFHIRVNGQPLKFWVNRPGEVLLNTPSAITFELTCGPQRPRNVAVEYSPYAGHEGVIVAIEFLNGAR